MKRRLRRSAGVLAAGLLLSLLAALGVGYAIWSSRGVAEREWTGRLSALTTMVAAHARQSIGSADLVLRSIAESVKDPPISTQEELRSALGSRETYEMLRDTARGVPQVDVATIVALNGDVINFTRSYPPPHINLADRDYFQAHLNDPKLELYLSAPVQNRGNGRWTFYLARKIRGPAGEMVGLVLTGLKCDFFWDFYADISVSSFNSISIYRADGTLLARYPVVESALGKSFAESATFRSALAGQESGATVTDRARVTDPGKAERRIIAARRSPDYPIVVAAGATSELYLEEWRRYAVTLGLAGGVLCIVLAGVTLGAARLVDKLEGARLEAMRAVELKSRFVSTVSHELRTPLNAIVGGTAHLLETDLRPDSRKFATLVSRASQHLLVLINDILDFSRLEAGRDRIETGPFVVREAMANVVEITKSLARADTLRIEAIIDPQVPAVLVGDCGRMTQVLLNLMSNGVKYTDAGSVILRAGYGDGRLQLLVSDTGRGLSADEQAQIFQPFERGAAASQGVQGTGLGLAITKRLVTALGGTIDLRSAPGQGATFTVVLPMAAASAPAPAASLVGEEAHPPRSLRILLAEDVAANRMLLEAHLAKLGQRVQAVANGKEAVEAVRRDPFDLVLMDIQMPEMDGVEATRQIRRLRGPAGRTPIVGVTAFGDDATHAGLMKAGMNSVLTKPVPRAELARIVAQVARRPVPGPAAAGEEASPGCSAIERQFRRDLGQALDDLAAAAHEGNSGRIRAAAHTLKGSLAMFGHSGLAEAAARVEQTLSADDIEALRQGCAGLLSGACEAPVA